MVELWFSKPMVVGSSPSSPDKKLLLLMSTIILTSPLEQFEIITILPFTFMGLNISITNSSFFLLFSVFVAIFWLYLSFFNTSVIPNS